ncbi:hypothetical protein [Actinomadura sp. DC4]|uniref:hypothetical protein n=1 Tax=Actinomadura sp. DC4 TaxID=3055069 RepID=UPI0025AF8623|nr:hypothetical protein [Actinomadura sp. DC4]MDN3352502.1 hypothetical protein [Actinomadura sp. DC4]
MRMVAALLVLAGGVVSGSPSPDHRLMLGATGQTRQETQQREIETGHRLDGVRVFRRWDERLFDGNQQWAKKTGHTVYLSIKSRRLNGAKLKWHDIATARPGSPLWSDMQRQANEIKQFGALVYVVFNHEPDARTSAPMGGPADFVAAWRHVVGTYRAAGVRNARFVWTMTGWAFTAKAGGGLTRADQYYPGDAYVDDIAADSYNWNTCHSASGTWQSPSQLVDPERRFGLRHPGKGLMLLEWGSVEDPSRPGRKAQWLRDMARLLASSPYRQFRAALYWDDRHTGQKVNSACNFDYRTSPDALNAWRSIATAPALAARTACDLGDCAKRPHRRSRLPLLAGGAPAAVILTGLIAFGIHRHRKAG